MSDRKLQNVEIENRDLYPQTSRYKNSRYYKREIRPNVFFIEPSTWEPPTLKEADDDLITKVDAGEENRLDLVSLRVYGTDTLWWVLLYFNAIVDPFEVPADTILRYPSFTRVASQVLV